VGLEDALVLGAVAVGGYVLYKRSKAAPVPVPGDITVIRSKVLSQSVKLPNPLNDKNAEIDKVLSGNSTHIPAPVIFPEKISPLAETYVSGTIVSSTPTNANYLTPEGAYKLVQQGYYSSQVKNKMASAYYTWGNVLETPIGQSAVRSGKLKAQPLAYYQNAARLAKVADRICRAYGSKITANTWIRTDSTTFHKSGIALDFGAPYSVCKQGGKLYNICRRIPEVKGVGYPTRSSQNAIHIDIGARGGVGSTQQFVFVDNGDGNYPGGVQSIVSPYL
jgi:hypothetical protein